MLFKLVEFATRVVYATRVFNLPHLVWLVNRIPSPGVALLHSPPGFIFSFHPNFDDPVKAEGALTIAQVTKST